MISSMKSERRERECSEEEGEKEGKGRDRISFELAAPLQRKSSLACRSHAEQ